MKSVYLAAPGFNEEQNERLRVVTKKLKVNKTVGNIYLPLAEENQNPDISFAPAWWKAETYRQDIDAINNSDIVIAIADFLEENGEIIPDPGTTFEIGYAVGINKPVYLVVFEGKPEDKTLNLMVDAGTTAHIKSDELPFWDFENVKNLKFNWKSV